MVKKRKPNNALQPAYNQEFKETAIKLALAGDRPVSQVASELGIPPSRLYDWVKAWKKKSAKVNGAETGKRSGDDELRRLQKRVKELEQENEILKKASAYFAKTLL